MGSCIIVSGHGIPAYLLKMQFNMRGQDFVKVSMAVQGTRNDNQFGPAVDTDASLDHSAATVISGRGLNIGL